ncbi:MAG TPA: LOG family protein [Candidatus Omnitrophota bacterium]|nr:LOG family protein [Candidatus Omnitrophota bacterium]
MKIPRKHKTDSTYADEMVRCIAVLGSGTVKSDHATYQQAIKLGALLAKAGFKICHGGYGGVMEAVARGCHEAGGKNIGITIKKLPHLTPGLNVSRPGVKTVKQRGLRSKNPWIDREIRMPFWQARLFKLVDMGDAYIFLDGATGTLNELFFIWEMTNKGLLDRPIILIGKRLRVLVQFLKKDPSVKIPKQMQFASTIPAVVRNLQG